MDQFGSSVKAAAAAFREVGWTWGFSPCGEPAADDIRRLFLENLRACVLEKGDRKYSNGRLTVDLDSNGPSVTFSLELGTVYGDDVFKLLAQVD